MKTGNNSLLKKMKHTLGFTLVELIVVISILVILGTIAFISLAGYSSSARDSNRIADFANISKGLQLIKTKTGLYPMPSSSTGITYSGWLVWTQGSVGDSVINILNTSGIKFSRKPMDPKYTNVEYTYSVLENNKEFQIATVMEQDSTALFPLISSAYAAVATENLTAYVLGNYNGIMARSKDPSNGNIYVLAIPSIILKDTNFTLLETILTQSGNLVINKKGNLPSTYFTTVQTAADKAFVYAPLGTPANAVGNGILAATSLPTDLGTLANLTSTLRSIYGTSELATDISSTPQVASLLASETTPANQNTIIASTLQTSLGGTNIVVDSSPNAGGGHILLSTLGATHITDNNLDGPLAAFNGPEDVTVDSAGNYYITDRLNNKIKKYNSAGHLLLTIWSGVGDNDLSGTAALLNSPYAVTIDWSGNIIVCEGTNFSGKIKKYDSNGNWILTIWDTLADPTDNAYFSSWNNELSGTSAQIWLPKGVAVDSLNNIYIPDTSHNLVKKYTSTGSWLKTFPSSVIFNSPIALAVDTAGFVYVASYGDHRIRKLTSTGMLFMTLWGTSGDNNLSYGSAKFNELTGVALDSAGNIYTSDSWNRKVKKYSWTGTYLMTIGSGIEGNNNSDGVLAQFMYPSWVKVDSAGYIYVSDSGNNLVKKYSSTGAYVSTIGHIVWDNQLSGTQAEFWYAMSIRDTSGNFYVGDYKHMKKYSPDGTFLFQIDVSTSDIAIAPNGDFYLVDGANSIIRKYNSAGTWILDFPTSGNPGSIKIDTSGNLFISEANNGLSVEKYSSTGTLLLTIGGGIWSDPENNLDGAAARLGVVMGIAVDNSGILYVSRAESPYYGESTIKKYDSSGHFIENLSINPRSFVIGSNGHIYWIANSYLSIVTEYTATGALIGDIIGNPDTRGDNTLAGTGAQFMWLWSIYIDAAGNITVADLENYKIKTYSN